MNMDLWRENSINVTVVVMCTADNLNMDSEYRVHTSADMSMDGDGIHKDVLIAEHLSHKAIGVW